MKKVAPLKQILILTELQVHLLVDNLPISDERLNSFNEHSLNDSVICKIKDYIIQGWTKFYKDVNVDIKPYYELKNELYVIQDWFSKTIEY